MIKEHLKTTLENNGHVNILKCRKWEKEYLFFVEFRREFWA